MLLLLSLAEQIEEASLVLLWGLGAGSTHFAQQVRLLGSLVLLVVKLEQVHLVDHFLSFLGLSRRDGRALFLRIVVQSPVLVSAEESLGFLRGLLFFFLDLFLRLSLPSVRARGFDLCGLVSTARITVR